MYLGIDPGKSGAIAVLDDSGEILEVVDMPCQTIGNRVFPDGAAIAQVISKCRHACIELVSSRPGQGVVSVFTFGQGFGGVVTLCSALVGDVQLESPQAWQKHFKLKKAKGEKSLSKQQIADRCLALYPDAPLYGPRGGLKDGRSDAILIARFLYDQKQ